MSRDCYDILYWVAEAQRGIFTSRQAVEAGFDGRNHHYHVKTGGWEREGRGIYRLKNFPYDPLSQYVVWSLWSCNKNGEPQGVYSHETALSIYDLSDLSPAKITMTVPHNFKRNAPTPGILILRKGELKASDWKDHGGYRVTTPVRTLYDVLNAKHISEEFIYQAVKEGKERGLYPKRELAKYGIVEQVSKYT